MNMVRYSLTRLIVAVSFTVCGVFFVVHRPNNNSSLDSFTQYSSLWTSSSLPVNSVNISILNPDHAVVKPRIILFWTPFFGGNTSYFGEEGDRLKMCPVSNCVMTADRWLLTSSDALIFHPMDVNPDDMPSVRNPDQYWIYFVLESPLHVTSSPPGMMYNLTFTYRLDSDIIADNYLQYFNLSVWSQEDLENNVKKRFKNSAAAFVSNCHAPSNRQDYIANLKQHFPVDVYGDCGDKVCGKEIRNECDTMVENYKFYLAFENSICKDYVTEKVIRAYKAGVVPIVMGGANYSAIFPPNSFINVMDFESPKKLAAYLTLLSNDLNLYKRHLQWRTERRYTRLPDYLSYEKVSLCKLCEILHWKTKLRKSYEDVDNWWVSGGNCGEWKSNEIV